ncbi:MAG: C_GCAxxG_C_C family protein [Atopobiaceae bacterium]|nr:C_GCAxxG_C_C family protein [Atopobiaceae bacterium]MBR3314966.1 C_GCAxxG_C_C family protein [Atopobiaceae bacterium]
MDASERGEKARGNFLQGYNCAQSVVLAFEDVLAEAGIDANVAARLSSPFGGGMGRMREVCGAVSGMLMVLGLVEGYDDPKAFAAKKELYARVQELAGAYAQENGSIVCRELLGLRKGPSEATPERRTDAYYRKRPCPELCACAARILAEHL